MIYPIYGPFNRFANFVQRPSRNDADPPQWNPDVITNLEMADRAVRQQRGTALGHTMMRSVSNPELLGGEAIDICDTNAHVEFPRGEGTDTNFAHYNIAMLKFHKELKD